MDKLSSNLASKPECSLNMALRASCLNMAHSCVAGDESTEDAEAAKACRPALARLACYNKTFGIWRKIYNSSKLGKINAD